MYMLFDRGVLWIRMKLITVSVSRWKSYMCTAIEETNIEAILAAINTT